MPDMEFNFEINPITRDKNGLITSGHVEYSFKEDGFIDWRNLIDPKYLVAKNRNAGTDTSNLSDRDLLILLNGIKELAQIRGYNYVSYNVVTAHPEYVMTSCEIEWIPNYETEGRTIKFQALADATLDNTDGFTRYYLAAIAENRAFVRCVRNFLKIDIVGKEEIGKLASELAAPIITADQTDPRYLLEKLMTDKKISFELIKTRLKKEEVKGASNFEDVSDIPKIKVFELIERIKKVEVA
jgi:hypothetical protein